MVQATAARHRPGSRPTQPPPPLPLPTRPRRTFLSGRRLDYSACSETVARSLYLLRFYRFLQCLIETGDRERICSRFTDDFLNLRLLGQKFPNTLHYLFSKYLFCFLCCVSICISVITLTYTPNHYVRL